MSTADNGMRTRRALLVAGGAIVAMGAGAYAWLRGGRDVNSANAAPVSHSFDDSNLCVLTAQMTEGPFYVEETLVRSDVREDRRGAELQLRLKIVDSATCKALTGAAVDIWHCDAGGDYSAKPARFLRGRQLADAQGIVSFVTIYPGWYQGRTPHIHLKVFVNEREAATSQLFFANALSAEVYASPPYTAKGMSGTSNDDDGVLRRGSEGAWPKMKRDGARLVGTLTVGVAKA